MSRRKQRPSPNEIMEEALTQVKFAYRLMEQVEGIVEQIDSEAACLDSIADALQDLNNAIHSISTAKREEGRM